MAVVQAAFPPIWWTKTSVNPLLFREQYISGTAEHDTQYCQIIQPITSYIPRDNTAMLISQPAVVGGNKTWQVLSGNIPPFGGVFTAAAGDYNDVWVQVTLETSRTCNCLTWEPYPSWLYELVSMTLLTDAGEVAMDLTNIYTTHHGPQRWFFSDSSCYGAEVRLKAFPSYQSNKVAIGTFKFELAYVTTQPGATCNFRLSSGTITSANAIGEGSISTSIVDTGVVKVDLTTPANGPTSIVRGFQWT
jgi:hypothetical protein